MTPEKMRALQRQIDELTAELNETKDRLEYEIGARAREERALKRRTADFKKARAKIKSLSAP